MIKHSLPLSVSLIACESKIRRGAVGGTIIKATLDQTDKDKLDNQTCKRYEEEEPLTTNDVIKTHQPGVEKHKASRTIQENECYPLTSDDVEQLTKAGVSRNVIKAMRENNIYEKD